MQKQQEFIPASVLEEQIQYSHRVRALLETRYPEAPPLCFVHSYGCQQNVADGEKMKSMLVAMGYGLCQSPDEADLVLYNTCAVREHAEDRVFGNVGALKHCKRRRPDMLIVLCGCMMQQEPVAEKIRRSFPYVDIVFGTHVLHRLPEMIFRALTTKSRVFEIEQSDGAIAELPVTHRDSGFKAFVPVMYGCNNFCSYCVVPYVRGRERSREPEAILEEIQGLVENGYREVMLLGQNVNSYGKTLQTPLSFAQLLRRVNEIPGRFRIRFMTSHPKDLTEEMICAMAECEKVCHHLHLPVQSGNDRILKLMNRHYDSGQYRRLVKLAREKNARSFPHKRYYCGISRGNL